MPKNNEVWNDTGQPVGGSDDGVHFRILKTLADGTVATSSAGSAPSSITISDPNTPSQQASVDSTGDLQVDVNNYGAGVVGANQVSVGNTATLIVGPNATRRGLVLVNHGTVDVFVGSSAGVTTLNGLLLTGVKGTAIGIPTTAALYGITASSQTVSYLEVYT